MALGASGSQASTTHSAIAPGTVTITSGDPASTAAAQTVSRDTSSANAALTQQFTDAQRAEIAKGFEAAQTLTAQVGTFLANQAASDDAAQKTIDANAKPVLGADGKPLTDASGRTVYQTDARGNYIPKDGLTAAQNEALQQAQTTADNTATWGAGGTGQLVLTALSGAAGGNVSGSLSSFVQAAAVNVLQGLATAKVKEIVDTIPADANGDTTTREATRTALQALTGCAGSAAGGSGDCGSAAMGAAASVVLNDLIAVASGARDNNPALDAQGKPLTSEQQLATQNLVSTLVAGIASASGLDANAATTAAQIETGNTQAKADVLRGLFKENDVPIKVIVETPKGP